MEFLMVAGGTALGGAAVTGALALAALCPIREAARGKLEDHGLRYEALTFNPPGGPTLRAWFVPHHKAQGRTVVLLHGRCGNKSQYLEHARRLHKLRVNVLLLDMR